MLQGKGISKVPKVPINVPHILKSPMTTVSKRNTYVLHECTSVGLLAAFKLTGSLCVCVDVLPIGRLLGSLRLLF